MTALFKMNTNILLSRRFFVINLFIILVLTILLLIFSDYYLEQNHLIIYQLSYYVDYYFESIQFIKLLVVILIVTILMHSKPLDDINNYTHASYSRVIVESSKLITFMIVVFMNLFCYFLLFEIIGIFLTPYMIFHIDHLYMLFRMLLFSLYYLLLGRGIYLYVKHYYATIGVILMYFIGSIFSEYLIPYGTENFSSMIAHFVFPDLVLYDSYQFAFVYGDLFIIVEILFLFILIQIKALHRDIV